jgi:7-cyano-7-deazaguanine reductase
MSNYDEDSLTVLGSKIPHPQTYSSSILESLPRAQGRMQVGINLSDNLPFSGFDLWTAYELSWLNEKGKPIVAIAEFEIPVTSPHLIESKSLKLYLNSFNQTKFKSHDAVAATLANDLSLVAGGEVNVRLYPHFIGFNHAIMALPGINIDHEDIDIKDYSFNPEILSNAVAPTAITVSEMLTSNLLKSNCLVTNQPDWGSLIIKYEGKQIDPKHLLRYIISFRNHNKFHEQCVERIFMDIKHYCRPLKLTVFARYTRRGGVDINPFRSDCASIPPVTRLIRQ